MERIEGTILRRDVPPELGLDRDAVAALCRTAIDTLVALHDVDVEAAGLADLDRGDGLRAPPGRGLVRPLPAGAHRRRR